MELIATDLPGVQLIRMPVYRDERGSFSDVFSAPAFAAAGLPTEWAQDSQSVSVRHVLRGMHYQSRSTQGKLVRAVTGRIFDVAVDLRQHSPTFGRWTGVTLEEGDGHLFYIPPGCAHGFLTLSDHAVVGYKLTSGYDPEAECVLAWNDPRVAIAWPLPEGVSPIQSARDAAAPGFDRIPLFA